MPRLREVAAGVLVATSRNDALNSVVIVRDSGAVILVDPGWDPDELDDLAAELDARALRPTAGLATHAHHDHVLWHPGFGDVPRWASPVTAELASSEYEDLRSALGGGYRPDLLELFAKVTPFTEQPLAGFELIVHDAHTPGHTAAWLPESGILIAGDMLSDVELPLLDDAGIEPYRAGLELLAGYASRASLIIPGHGNIGTDGAARVSADRRYLAALAAGEDPEDARLDNPGMRDAHAANVAHSGRNVGRTRGFGHEFRKASWERILDRYEGLLDKKPQFESFGHIRDIIQSILDSGVADQLAGCTSMHDLLVAAEPVRPGPIDIIWVHSPSSLRRPPDGFVVIEHATVSGHNDVIARPVAEAVPLFWRFVKEKFGVEAPPRA